MLWIAVRILFVKVIAFLTIASMLTMYSRQPLSGVIM